MGIFSVLYDRVIELAGNQHAKRYLAIVSFAEASFFPVPADVMLAPMILADPRKAFGYARVAIYSSVCGGILGYLLGYFAFHPIVEPFIKTFGYEETYYKALELFRIWGFWLLCLVGCVPIPYKLFTISAGMLQYNILLFIISSIVGRSLRYFLVSAAIKAGGKKMDILLRRFVDRVVWFIIIAILAGITIKLIW